MKHNIKHTSFNMAVHSQALQLFNAHVYNYNLAQTSN